jgi:hypothetical protein
MNDIPVNYIVSIKIGEGQAVAFVFQKDIDKRALCLATTTDCHIHWDTKQPYGLYYTVNSDESQQWKPVAIEDLPLYVGWPYVWPLLGEVIKTGEFPDVSKYQ